MATGGLQAPTKLADFAAFWPYAYINLQVPEVTELIIHFDTDVVDDDRRPPLHPRGPTESIRTPDGNAADDADDTRTDVEKLLFSSSSSSSSGAAAAGSASGGGSGAGAGGGGGGGSGGGSAAAAMSVSVSGLERTRSTSRPGGVRLRPLHLHPQHKHKHTHRHRHKRATTTGEGGPDEGLDELVEPPERLMRPQAEIKAEVPLATLLPRGYLDPDHDPWRRGQPLIMTPGSEANP